MKQLVLNSPDEQLTLFKLLLHAFHFRLVAAYTVQTLSVQAWGEKRAEQRKEGKRWVGRHSGKQAKHKYFIRPFANRHDSTDAAGF